MGGRGRGPVFRAGDALEGLTWLKPGWGVLVLQPLWPIGTTGPGGGARGC